MSVHKLVHVSTINMACWGTGWWYSPGGDPMHRQSNEYHLEFVVHLLKYGRMSSAMYEKTPEDPPDCIFDGDWNGACSMPHDVPILCGYQQKLIVFPHLSTWGWHASWESWTSKILKRNANTCVCLLHFTWSSKGLPWVHESRKPFVVAVIDPNG